MKKAYLETPEELAPYFITEKEARCHVDGNKDKPCPDCGGKIFISVEVARRFKSVRLAVGGPLTINSGYRCREKQERLWKNASKEEQEKGLVAKPGSSPHETGHALDVAKPSRFKTPMDFAEFILKTLGGDVRLGAKKYKSFVHMDALHLTGKPRGIRW